MCPLSACGAIIGVCALTGYVLIFLRPALSALVPVILPSPASATAGEVMELSCSVPVMEHLGQSPTLDWSGGSVGQPGVAVTDLTTLGANIWRNISFSPLKTSHGGQYVCQAGLSIPAFGLEETWASSRDLSVQSEWLSCAFCWSVLVLHVCPPHSPQASGDCFWSLSWHSAGVWLLSGADLLHPATRVGACGHTLHYHVQVVYSQQSV